MSAWTHCDNECGAQEPVGAESLDRWLRVTWLGLSVTADYCTTACAVEGVERARDEDAALQLAALDAEKEEDDGS